ncbi:MAG: cation transporter [Ignisphaera sp.]|uniref:Cation efflux protein transmembrane domain-containing protein n=1 Tax=Ignisphaera aggregans TaxID=334771 RepID=A0A7J3MZL7_9CREN
MNASMKEIRYRFRETYRMLIVVVLLSIAGLVIEFVFAYMYSSMILYTDVVHWIVDTALEIISLIMFFIISKIYRKFDWSVFILEYMISIFVILVVFGFYILSLIEYVSAHSTSMMEPSTTNIYLAIITVIGGIITFITFSIEKKAYRRLKTEILKIDSTHAIIDVIVSIIVSIGIVLTALTKNLIIELVVVLFVFFVALQTLLSLAKDILKSILGFESNPHLKIELVSRLNKIVSDKVVLGNVELKKIGSIYIAKVEIYLDPKTTIGEAHKLRETVNIICREVSELIYHVDVVFYPKKRYRKVRKSEKQYSRKY